MVFAWAIIRKTFDISKFVFSNGRERTGFGNVMADKFIENLVRFTLPARVGINKLRDGSERFIDQGMIGELLTVIIGRSSNVLYDRLQTFDNGCSDKICGLVLNIG